MKLNSKSVLDFGLMETMEIFNQGFSDYLIPIRMDPVNFHRMICIDSIDVTLSRVVIDQDGKGLGLGLIARRGWNSRLAGMAIVPPARGKGVGQWLMDILIEEAKIRGDHRMELEVIKGNDSAINLYRKNGLQTFRKLLSFSITSPLGEPHDLVPIDIREVANKVAAYGLPKLPWQISSESLAQSTPPYLAFYLDSAWAVIASPQEDQIQIRSLVVDPDHRRQGRASRLFRGLFYRFKGKTWVVPALFPEEMEGFFEYLGFRKQPLSQYQMEIKLTRADLNF